MPLSIRRTRQAQLDQNDIWLNIAEDSVRAADSVLERVNAAIFLIAEQPEAGRARPELRAGSRYFPVESYLIFYDVQPASSRSAAYSTGLVKSGLTSSKPRPRRVVDPKQLTGP